MLTDVETHRVFTEEEIAGLKKDFDRGYSFPDARWQNISNIFITPLPDNDPYINHYINKLIKKSEKITSTKWQPFQSFLLEYHPGGQADLHIDKHATRGGISLITLVDQEDLEGGDIIVVQDDHVVDVKQKIGDTTFYKADVVHGVSKVTSGYRRVLVTWLEPKEEQSEV